MIDLWWEALNTPLRIYYTIAIATSFILFLQFIMLLVGLDGDGDFDMDGDGGDLGHGDGGTNLFSMRAIVAFFTGFGWTGVTALEAGWGLFGATMASFVVGLLFMGMILLIIRGLYSLQADGTLNYANAIGQAGSVYAPIGANMSRPGQVEVMVQGRLRTVSALTRSDRSLSTGERVKVSEQLDEGTLIVSPLDQEQT